MSDLKKLIREVPDWPKKGILFYDITTLLKDAAGLHDLIDAIGANYLSHSVDVVVGVEARGFIFAPAVAYRLKAGFVPVRKPGKLPYNFIQESYDLEYGTAELQMHEDGVVRDARVLIIDDLLATGGTAHAAVRLVNKIGGQVVGCGFVVELNALKGRERLAPVKVTSLIHYD